jgi:hypothetical protein
LDFQIDNRLVIVHGFNIQSVRATSRNDESSINIATEPKAMPFEEYSALFQAISESYADGSVEVYAPVTWETRAERRRIRNKLRDPIDEVVNGLIKDALSDGNKAKEESQN